MSSGTHTRTFEKKFKNNEEKQKILKFGTNPKFVKISSELNVGGPHSVQWKFCCG